MGGESAFFFLLTAIMGVSYISGKSVSDNGPCLCPFLVLV